MTQVLTKTKAGRARSGLAGLQRAKLGRADRGMPERSLAKPRTGARTQRVGLLYILPALALFGLIIVYPVARSMWLSLFNWNGVTSARWVGLQNYISALSDPTVLQAFLHSLILIAFYSAIPISLGLVLAAIIARHPVRGMHIWRVLLFLPQIISVVVVGIAWQWVLEADGPLNWFLRLIDLSDLTKVWLGDFTWALPSEGVIGTWLMSGLCMVLFIAGAQSIDTELYDAANVDGAGPVREFFAITVPGLRNVIVVASILTFAVSLNNFSLIWVTTQGGPGTSTEVVSTLIYTQAFVENELGAASALAVVLGAVMMAVSFGISRFSTTV